MKISLSLNITFCCLLHALISTSCFSQTIDLVQNSPVNQQKLQAELDNIRALPFGFAAVCEQQDLKIRAAQSATFVIRNSLLCEQRRNVLGLAVEDAFILCSNDPEHASNETAEPVKCFNLE